MKSGLLGGGVLFRVFELCRGRVVGRKVVCFLGHYESEDRSFADRMVLPRNAIRNTSSLRKVDESLVFGMWWKKRGGG
jgi:hypothetical protein